MARNGSLATSTFALIPPIWSIIALSEDFWHDVSHLNRLGWEGPTRLRGLFQVSINQWAVFSLKLVKLGDVDLPLAYFALNHLLLVAQSHVECALFAVIAHWTSNL